MIEKSNFKKSQKWCGGTKKYANLSDFGSHFGAGCLALSSDRGCFVCDLFFGPSGGYPHWIDFGIHWGPIFLTFWKNLGAICSKCPRFQCNKWHQQHLHKNKQGFNKYLPILNPHNSCFTFVVQQSRVSPTPQVLKKQGRRNSRRGNNPPPPARRGQGVPDSVQTLHDSAWLCKIQKLFGRPLEFRRPLRQRSSFHNFIDFSILFLFFWSLQKSSKIGPLSNPSKILKIGILAALWCPFHTF